MLRMLHRFVAFVGRLQHVPRALQLSFELVEATAEVARHDFVAAERRLVRVYQMGFPEPAMLRSTAELLRALISLKLGNPQAAVDRAPTAVRNVGLLRSYVNSMERAYLQYAGRIIFEEASYQLGLRKTINVAVEFDDLDIGRVRSELRDAFPVYRSRYADDPTFQ